MKIGRSTGYAILAACHIASDHKRRATMSQMISREYDIPLEYLLKILQQLVKANILRSKRGPRGGFSLARPPKKITLLQIIEAVDGPLLSQMSIAEHANRARFGARADKALAKALSQTRDVFKKTTLADLIEG